MENTTEESAEQCARLSKFPVQCRTELIDYLGEHQAQVFYARLLIDQITTPTGALEPIRIGIGQSIPVDLTNRYDQSEEDRKKIRLVLAMPVYFFKRERNCRLDQASYSADCNERSCADAMDVSCEHTSSKRVLASGPKSQRNFISLITLIVYFPVDCMDSANDLCVVGDQQKRVHLPPHPHEFVAYPNTITLPVEELGDRIVWGLQHADRLLSYSMQLPTSLLTEHLSWRTDSKKPQIDSNASTALDSVKNDHGANNTQDTTIGRKFPTFTVISRGVYNRLQTVQRIQTEGICFDKLERPNNMVSRLWYSKTLKPSKTQPGSIGCSDLNENSFRCSALNGLISLLRWSGLRVSTDANRSAIECASDSVSVNSTLVTHGQYRVAFVRRQSFDCGTVIDSAILTAQYSPAKLRRTRVRGTLHCGIKLKRRCTDSDGLGDGSGRMELSSDLIPSHLVVKRNCGEDEVSWCIVSPSQSPGRPYQEPAGWYTAFHSHSVDDARCSATGLHSSIAARVKRVPHVISERSADPSDTKNGGVQTCFSQSADTVTNDLADDVLIRPRNRVPPRRFDLTDPDLEIALKRSLLEQTPLRKRKSESDISEANDRNFTEPCCHNLDTTTKQNDVRNGERIKRSRGSTTGNKFRNHRSRSAPRGNRDRIHANKKLTRNELIISNRKHPTGYSDENLDPSYSKAGETGVYCFQHGQGEKQLSCSVTTTTTTTTTTAIGTTTTTATTNVTRRFIPKLKLAKRSNGKFKILRLARKRHCSLRYQGKLHGPYGRSKIDSRVFKESKPNNSPQITSQSLSETKSTELKIESSSLGNLVCSGPLNLSIHNRTHDLIDSLESKQPSTEVSPELSQLHDSNGFVSHSYANPPVLDPERPGLTDLDGHLTPLTMWTKLKNPLPAPEPFSKVGPNIYIPPTPTTVIPNNGLMTPLQSGYTTQFEPVPSTAYPRCTLLHQSQPSLSTLYPVPRTETILHVGTAQTIVNETKPSAFAETSNPYTVLGNMKPSLQSSMLPSVPVGMCCSAPMYSFTPPMNTTLPGLTFPIKLPVSNTFPQITAPVIFPNIVPSWSILRDPCPLNRENPIQVFNSWDMTSSQPNNPAPVGKVDSLNTMYFIQPAIPDPTYGCHPSGLGWPQPHDGTSTWPTIQSLPPVQFIT